MVLLFVILFASAACEDTGSSDCKGDFNASYTDCPIACPSTCAKPNAEYCGSQCGTQDCACNPGYILSDINGKCIKPEDCPGGKVCGPNEIFQDCLVRCPNIYCPVNDKQVACDPARPCPSGCGCQSGYLRKSLNEYTCIPSSECSSVNCTRPNEELNLCPGACFSDSCRDRYKKTEICAPNKDDCKPRCVCKEDFYRNTANTCVTAEMCPEIFQPC